MKLASLKNVFPSATNAGLAIISAILLILAFPDFDFWFLAWVALIPLFFAIEREKESWKKSFLTGWIFGIVFFFGTCWWLTFAPITYAKMPTILTYILMLFVSAIVGIFPAIFGAIFSILLKRFGTYAILSAPFIWVFTEFLRYWLTGNNWNAIGYSQAFHNFFGGMLGLAKIGGIYLVSFNLLTWNSLFFFAALLLASRRRFLLKDAGIIIALSSYTFSPLVSPFLWVFKNVRYFIKRRWWRKIGFEYFIPIGFYFLFSATTSFVTQVQRIQYSMHKDWKDSAKNDSNAYVVAVQPNVPMSGITYEKYQQLLERHVQLAEIALKQQTTDNGQRTTVIFPESPMIFQYGRDRELQEYLKNFAVRNNASVLFNSAEMTESGNRVLNSAVMINERGEKSAQYDKIHLLPFGEFIPFPEPLASQMPAFVGNFEFGNEYDLLNFGEAKGGVMICFESHFGELSREYAKRGADVLIEMTNDGYLGKTPVLRQHLANSVFRAVETNRPLLRVTNVGITAYINERGEISDAAEDYTEATRVWTISKSDGSQTIYTKYGDWFAWLCSLVSLALLFLSFRKGKIDEK